MSPGLTYPSLTGGLANTAGTMESSSGASLAHTAAETRVRMGECYVPGLSTCMALKQRPKADLRRACSNGSRSTDCTPANCHETQRLGAQ